MANELLPHASTSNLKTKFFLIHVYNAMHPKDEKKLTDLIDGLTAVEAHTFADFLLQARACENYPDKAQRQTKIKNFLKQAFSKLKDTKLKFHDVYIPSRLRHLHYENYLKFFKDGNFKEQQKQLFSFVDLSLNHLDECGEKNFPLISYENCIRLLTFIIEDPKTSDDIKVEATQKLMNTDEKDNMVTVSLYDIYYDPLHKHLSCNLTDQLIEAIFEKKLPEGESYKNILYQDKKRFTFPHGKLARDRISSQPFEGLLHSGSIFYYFDEIVKDFWKLKKEIKEVLKKENSILLEGFKKSKLGTVKLKKLSKKDQEEAINDMKVDHYEKQSDLFTQGNAIAFLIIERSKYSRLTKEEDERFWNYKFEGNHTTINMFKSEEYSDEEKPTEYKKAKKILKFIISHPFAPKRERTNAQATLGRIKILNSEAEDKLRED